MEMFDWYQPLRTQPGIRVAFKCSTMENHGILYQQKDGTSLVHMLCAVNWGTVVERLARSIDHYQGSILPCLTLNVWVWSQTFSTAKELIWLN